jgi:hypothetical protein
LGHAAALLVALRRAVSDIGPPLVIGKLVTFVTVAIAVGVQSSLSWDSFLHAFNYWDAPSYIHISQHGYPTCIPCTDGYYAAFLPGFPLMVRAATKVMQDAVLGGVVVNIIAEALALFYVARLIAHERDRSAGRFAAWCIALAPFGIFLSAVYTESSFLAAAAAALYYSRSGHTGKATIAAACACAIRLTGIILVPVLILDVLLRHQRRVRELLIPILAVAPLALYVAYMAATAHDGVALLDANRLHFNHSFASPWQGFSATWDLLGRSDPAGRVIWGREVISGVLGFLAVVAVIIWCARRKLAPSLAAYCALAWLMATSLSFWRSVGRYEMAIFPALIILVDLTARYRILRPVFVVASGAAMVWGTTLYSTGQWLS